MQENRTFSYEEVLGSFHSQVQSFINDSKRVPAREYSKEKVLAFAEDIYKKQYNLILHEEVLDKYR